MPAVDTRKRSTEHTKRTLHTSTSAIKGNHVVNRVEKKSKKKKLRLNRNLFKTKLYSNFPIFFWKNKKMEKAKKNGKKEKDSKEFYELINGEAKVAYLSFYFVLFSSSFFLINSLPLLRYHINTPSVAFDTR